MSSSRKRTLRARIGQRNALLVPGAFNAMSARIVADLGFEAVYLSGAGLTNMHFAMPDLAFAGVAEIAEHTARIRDAVDIPLIVDMDTGFGNALNVRHAVRTLERAGADALQIEDQLFPKRCGHFEGKQVAPIAEMVARIQAVVDARHDDDLVLVARTDACAAEGFEAAVDRARAYAEAGADVLFVEATVNADQVRLLPSLLEKPQLMNIVIGGKTPVLGQHELAQLGFGLVLYANAALQGATLGMQNALRSLRSNGRLYEDPTLVASFSERQRLVNKPYFDKLENEYAI